MLDFLRVDVQKLKLNTFFKKVNVVTRVPRERAKSSFQTPYKKREQTINFPHIKARFLLLKKKEQKGSLKMSFFALPLFLSKNTFICSFFRKSKKTSLCLLSFCSQNETEQKASFGEWKILSVLLCFQKASFLLFFAEL